MTLVMTPIPRLTPFAAPALTLAVANAEGSAPTTIRSDADLLAFDVTVPTTQGSGDVAATGSAPVTAHRDHLHGMPVIPLATNGTGLWSITFGGNAVGVTFSEQNYIWQRLGDWVTITGTLILTNKGSSNGSALLTGLPSTIRNGNNSFTVPSLEMQNISFANQFLGLGNINTTEISLFEVTEAGVLTTLTDANFANNSVIRIQLTYRAA